jgi:hypothetical protein
MSAIPRSILAIPPLFLLHTVLAVAILPAARHAEAASCPENRIVFTDRLGVVATVVSNEAALDTAGTYWEGGYDLKNGMLRSKVGFYSPGSYEWKYAGTLVDTEDEYRIVGLPAGTPLDFTAEFVVGGSWNVYPGVPQGEFSCEAFLAVDADTSRFSVPLPGGCCHGTIGQTLSLSLHRLAEEPFKVHLHLGSHDYSGHVDVSGLLRFSGLPVGATVVSCQVYGSDSSTPTKRTTWGQLKNTYR